MNAEEHHATGAGTADAYATELRHAGYLIRRYTCAHECDLIREAGRKAGRVLHRPVRTFDSGNTVHVVLADWGDNPLETQLTDARIRRALDTADTDAQHTRRG